ncbi:uncharacterized protein N7506_008866 [Penicillium brevicompactum]|uniref:uncharacterized protein n=1 Tax=Penicillium brevicompactum TaxID=5074 RepID=UPI0025417C9E|nr:uncharacterized protein N7506_008866 [Penicillium brevicompactum]KAJ5325764.1 hypothetical protein N7506_008866 [Penicillium brevicompactum]
MAKPLSILVQPKAAKKKNKAILIQETTITPEENAKNGQKSENRSSSEAGNSHNEATIARPLVMLAQNPHAEGKTPKIYGDATSFVSYLLPAGWTIPLCEAPHPASPSPAFGGLGSLAATAQKMSK